LDITSTLDLLLTPGAAQARATEGQKYYYGVIEKTNKNEKGEEVKVEVKKKIRLAFHIMFQMEGEKYWAHLTKEVKVTEEEPHEHAASHPVEQGAVFWLRGSHKEGFLDALELLCNELLAVVNPSKGM
jgi:hypothetical protein